MKTTTTTISFAMKFHLNSEKCFYISGRTSDSVSSQMYVYDMVSQSWSHMKNRYGRESSRRLYGHSACYDKARQTIVVFSGYHSYSEL